MEVPCEPCLSCMLGLCACKAAQRLQAVMQPNARRSRPMCRKNKKDTKPTPDDECSEDDIILLSGPSYGDSESPCTLLDSSCSCFSRLGHTVGWVVSCWSVHACTVDARAMHKTFAAQARRLRLSTAPRLWKWKVRRHRALRRRPWLRRSPSFPTVR